MFKRSLLALFLVLLANSIPASAQEIPAFHTSKSDVQKWVETLTTHRESALYPGIPLGQRFKSISAAIGSLAELEIRGLLVAPRDHPKLNDFVEKAIRARLAELQVVDIAFVPMPPGKLVWPTSCDSLNVAFDISAPNFDPQQPDRIVVVINMLLWQASQVQQSDGSLACAEDRLPPRMVLQSTKAKLLQRGEHDQSMVLLQQTLLSMIDWGITRRILATNPAALDTVKSWIQGGN